MESTQLGRDHQRSTTTFADEGMLPVPIEARVNLTIITSDSAKVQEQARDEGAV